MQVTLSSASDEGFKEAGRWETSVPPPVGHSQLGTHTECQAGSQGDYEIHSSYATYCWSPCIFLHTNWKLSRWDRLITNLPTRPRRRAAHAWTLPSGEMGGGEGKGREEDIKLMSFCFLKAIPFPRFKSHCIPCSWAFTFLYMLKKAVSSKGPGKGYVIMY